MTDNGKILLKNALSWTEYLQSAYRLILGRFQLRHLIHASQHFVGHRVIHTIIPVLDVLFCQRPGRWHLMPIGALSPTFALAADEEAADGCFISLQGSEQ